MPGSVLGDLQILVPSIPTIYYSRHYDYPRFADEEVRQSEAKKLLQKTRIWR